MMRKIHLFFISTGFLLLWAVHPLNLFSDKESLYQQQNHIPGPVTELMRAAEVDSNSAPFQESAAGPEMSHTSPLLILPGSTFSLENNTVPWMIVNLSPDPLDIQLVPLLEKEAEDTWVEVPPVQGGFCGTPTSIKFAWQDALFFEWYGDTLTSGTYRLSFPVPSDPHLADAAALSSIFELTEGPADTTELLMIPIGEDFSNTGISLLLANFSDSEYLFGSHYILEQKTDDGWQPVSPVITDYAFTDEGYLLKPHSTEKIEIQWAWLYGSLEKGSYRLLKDILLVRSPGDYDTFPVLAYFTL